MDIYLFSELREDIKIESSLGLINKALRLDDENCLALNHKAIILFRKKDSKGLIRISDKLFQITDNPFYLGQKAIYLELEGKSRQAEEYYSRALDKYPKFLKSDTLNFDFMIEYIEILEASGATLKADKVLNDMKQMDFEDYQKEKLEVYKEESISKERIAKYWAGEIKYDEIPEK